MLRTAEPYWISAESDAVPPRLEAGDHLQQYVFHRLYEASPPGFRAELIEGVVIVPSPTRCDHGDIQAVVRWFVAEGGRFAPRHADADGVFRSIAFPGLWLDGPAVWADNGTKVMETIQRGMASPEHVAFVEKLRSQRG